jgi:hypothetical protein
VIYGCRSISSEGTCRIIERIKVEFSNFLDPVHARSRRTEATVATARGRSNLPSMTRFEEGRDGGEAKEIDGQDEDEDVVADGT